MQTNRVILEIDPFFISYRNLFLPVSPDGDLEKLEDVPVFLVFDILGCVQPILLGEIYSFKFMGGMDYLVIIPWGGEVTLIFLTTNIVNYKSEHSITVPTNEFLYAILHVVENMMNNEIQANFPVDLKKQLSLFYERTIELICTFGYNNYEYSRKN
jgi:hypothetical protein